MTKTTLTKAETTRRLNLLAGVRPAMPGQPHTREPDLRRSMCECFEPVDAIEMMYVNDIAYASASIEVYRAQIAGFSMRAVRQAYQRQSNADVFDLSGLAGVDDAVAATF